MRKKFLLLICHPCFVVSAKVLLVYSSSSFQVIKNMWLLSCHISTGKKKDHKCYLKNTKKKKKKKKQEHKRFKFLAVNYILQ